MEEGISIKMRTSTMSASDNFQNLSVGKMKRGHFKIKPLPS